MHRRKQLKCLSLRQPYADLVVTGRKTIETRKWNTNFRGKFLVHASKAIDTESAALLNIDCSKAIKSAVIEIAFLYDVKNMLTRKIFWLTKRNILALCFVNQDMDFYRRVQRD